MLSAINKDYKVAIVVVTHSLELADSMNMVYELRDGNLTNISETKNFIS
jgi:ABC-type lipoprotein export system ATPase subunit